VTYATDRARHHSIRSSQIANHISFAEGVRFCRYCTLQYLRDCEKSRDSLISYTDKLSKRAGRTLFFLLLQKCPRPRDFIEKNKGPPAPVGDPSQHRTRPGPGLVWSLLVVLFFPRKPALVDVEFLGPYQPRTDLNNEARILESLTRLTHRTTHLSFFN
jgi:hypothetical protein